MANGRLKDKFKDVCILITCADCGKVKKHNNWVKLTVSDWERLRKREIRIILDSCGCLAIKALNDWKG